MNGRKKFSFVFIFELFYLNINFLFLLEFFFIQPTNNESESTLTATNQKLRIH